MEQVTIVWIRNEPASHHRDLEWSALEMVYIEKQRRVVEIRTAAFFTSLKSTLVMHT